MKTIKDMRTLLDKQGFRPAPATEDLMWHTLMSPRWTLWTTARFTMKGRAYSYGQHYVRRAKRRMEALVAAGVVEEVRSVRGRHSYRVRQGG